jgi:predicted transcriptional regulator
MTTKTVRLPERLQARVERLAAARGSTAHAFMLEAIAEAADRVERKLAFEAEAERRLKEMARTGEYLTHDDLRAYGAALARGDKPVPPKPRGMTPQELARMRASLRRTG